MNQSGHGRKKPFFEDSEMNIVYTESDINPDDQECRICLQPKSEDNPLLVPCKCIGSVKYVHEGCMREWIQRQYEKNTRQLIECELCKEPILYTTEKKKICNTGELVKQKIKDDCKAFAFLLFLFLMTLTVAIYLLIAISSLATQTKPKAVEVGVLSFSILLILIICLIICSILCSKYLYTERRIVMSIMSLGTKIKLRQMIMKSQENLSRARIHPINVSEM